MEMYESNIYTKLRENEWKEIKEKGKGTKRLCHGKKE